MDRIIFLKSVEIEVINSIGRNEELDSVLELFDKAEKIDVIIFSDHEDCIGVQFENGSVAWIDKELIQVT